ncbi:MAG TPA: hypothetical protein VFI95_14430 [Terriglobales bacterium]|nr:hypothetical protein [Terriglobales bacterium]
MVPAPWLLVDEIAVLHEFADQGIDLLQTERGLRTAFQIPADETVFLNSHLQRGGAGLVGGGSTVFLG